MWKKIRPHDARYRGESFVQLFTCLGNPTCQYVFQSRIRTWGSMDQVSEVSVKSVTRWKRFPNPDYDFPGKRSGTPENLLVVNMVCFARWSRRGLGSITWALTSLEVLRWIGGPLVMLNGLPNRGPVKAGSGEDCPLRKFMAGKPPDAEPHVQSRFNNIIDRRLTTTCLRHTLYHREKNDNSSYCNRLRLITSLFKTLGIDRRPLDRGLFVGLEIQNGPKRCKWQSIKRNIPYLGLQYVIQTFVSIKVSLSEKHIIHGPRTLTKGTFLSPHLRWLPNLEVFEDCSI